MMAFISDENRPTAPAKKVTLSNGWRFDEKIKSDPNNCAVIITCLLEKLDAFKWSNRDAFGIHMAMEEAVMNAIRHGNKLDKEKEVHVLIELSSTRFFSRVTDQGSGFDPTKVPDPTLDENLEKTCGRGVMLMNNFVDKVTYNEVGNSVQLEKNKSE